MATFQVAHLVEGDMGLLERRDREFTAFVEEHGDARVRVSIAGVSQTATIACFTQVRGWCSYAAVVPIAIENYWTQPATVRVS